MQVAVPFLKIFFNNITKHLPEMGQPYLAVVRNFTISSLIHPAVDTRGDCAFLLYIFVCLHTLYVNILWCCPLSYGLQRLNAFPTRHNSTKSIYIVLRLYVCMHCNHSCVLSVSEVFSLVQGAFAPSTYIICVIFLGP